ncbi:hypothetical protein Dsui_2232 [Azospira oryzae PS]|uniref:Uncharacterized protein n=2 Tax=Azospira oryzae TaxID=146939 RepID=G8QKB2_AZOOP|nr:hypothetical protein Dsui_2232 [Azospira oryzae PS]
MNNASSERIRMKVGGMGDDEFERFMSDLLPRIYPGFNSLEPSFNFMGKTTKGKCDAHVYHSQDDTYTAIICTTQQSEIHKKVLGDIAKLSSTKFSSKIRRVLLCVNTPIKDEVEDYRTACGLHGWELDPLSLERITRHTLGEADLLLNYFGELSPRDPASPLLLRRFDCGNRIKEARQDISLQISRLIEQIDFPSEREWKAIESGEVEIAELYINALSALTGVSGAWLKHGAGAKYPSEVIYDHQVSKVEAIAAEAPLASYIAIEPSSMDAVLIVQFSELRWRVFPFGFSLDFWDWIGDQHHIPTIFKLLKSADRLLKHPYGRVISPSLMKEFRAEEKHPSISFKKSGYNNYWFDDLFDLYHRYPIAKDKYRHHGEWFVKLQNEFRNYQIDSSAPEIRDADDV